MRADRTTAVEPSVSPSSPQRRIFRWRKRPARSEGEQRLDTALRRAACPVCLATEGVDAVWLRRFLQEGYQIPDVLGQVARDRGFCGRHGEWLASCEDYSATVAHVHAVILRRAVDDLGRRRGNARAPSRLGLACRACAHESEVSRTESFFFARTLARASAGRYGDPAMLCARHLGTALDWMDRRTLEAVLGAHTERLGAPGAAALSLAGHPGKQDPAGDIESSETCIARVIGEPRQRASRVASDGADLRASLHDPRARLKARLADDSCAVCAEMRQLQRHWIHWIDAESASDERLEDILPVCPHHVWNAFHGGGAALQERLIEHAVRQERARILHARRMLGGAPRSTPGPRPALIWPFHRSAPAWPFRRRVPGSVRELLQRSPRCPLCDALAAAERRTIELLGILLSESGAREALERGFGVCARHTLQAASLLGQQAAAALTAAMRVKFDAMIWELDELLRRSAWNARAEPPGAQDPAWRRAVLLVSGRMA